MEGEHAVRDEDGDHVPGPDPTEGELAFCFGLVGGGGGGVKLDVGWRGVGEGYGLVLVGAAAEDGAFDEGSQAEAEVLVIAESLQSLGHVSWYTKWGGLQSQTSSSPRMTASAEKVMKIALTMLGRA